jgi:hypothetical protein
MTKDYKQLTEEYKNLLKGFNSDINTSYSGTYIDVTSNAIGVLSSGVYNYVDMINEGNQLDNANEFMVGQWLQACGQPARKTGFYAGGEVEITLVGGTTELLIPKGTLFTFNVFQYETVSEYTVTVTNNKITVKAASVGAEFNIASGVTLDTSLTGVASSISQGIGGGSGVETVADMQIRLKSNLSFRKTDSQANDFSQFALNYFSYAVTSVIRASGDDPLLKVVPVGANVTVCNTINDFDLASKNTVINEISATDVQLEDLKYRLGSYKNTCTMIETSTISTQPVANLKIFFTASTTLGASDIVTIKEATRKSLLQFQDNFLFPRSLDPDILDLVQTFYLEDFPPVEKISLYMDSITIQAEQYTL